MYVPTPVVIAMWAMLFLVCGLTAILYRQLGHYYGLGSEHDNHHGLAPGTVAPHFEFEPLNGSADGWRAGFPTTGAPALLMFADPGCASCEVALHSFERAVEHDAVDPANVLVVTSASQEVVNAVRSFADTAIPLGRVPISVLDEYDCHVSPLAFSVDSAGVVRISGSPASEREVKALWREATAAQPAARAGDQVDRVS